MSVIITAISLVHGYEGEICVHGYEREIRVRRRRSFPIPRLMNDFKNKKKYVWDKNGFVLVNVMSNCIIDIKSIGRNTYWRKNFGSTRQDNNCVKLSSFFANFVSF